LEKALEIQQLTKKYSNNQGVESINLTVYPGDIYGFIGPNGAGKTTVMKCITGLCHPRHGTIKIFGQDIKDNFEGAMEQVGCVVGPGEAYEYLTVYENLQLVARFHPTLPKTRINETLSLVGLAEKSTAKAETLSQGMRQRLALACALLPQPKLIILDEPTNGLDIDGKLLFHNLITTLAKDQGITFFISSHLIHEMERLWNRLAIIYGGKIVTEVASKDLPPGLNLEDFYIQQTAPLKGGN
jgi:ABC-2 type transport system ATP-binding protein